MRVPGIGTPKRPRGVGQQQNHFPSEGWEVKKAEEETRFCYDLSEKTQKKRGKIKGGGCGMWGLEEWEQKHEEKSEKSRNNLTPSFFAKKGVIPGHDRNIQYCQPQESTQRIKRRRGKALSRRRKRGPDLGTAVGGGFKGHKRRGGKSKSTQ